MDDKNLFTDMFGLESEEKAEEQLPNPIEPEVKESSSEIELPSLASEPIKQPEEVVNLSSTEVAPKEEQTEPLPTISIVPKETNDEFEAHEEKKSPAVIIFLIIALIGGGLLMFITTFIESIPKENKKTEVQEEPTTTIVEKVETNNKTITAFDTTFSFVKGYTENPNELNQTAAFTPEKSEGVIKCENIEVTKQNGVLKKDSIYIYYRDYMSKKIILSTNYKYSSNYQYDTYTSSLENIKTESKKHENLTVKINNNNVELYTNLHILVDLAYGNAFEYSDDYYSFEIPMNYNAQINTAMNKILSKAVNKENMHCSTLITE